MELEDTRQVVKDMQGSLQKKEVSLASAEGKVHVLGEELRNKVCIQHSQFDYYV